jgi:hypothetical protein
MKMATLTITDRDLTQIVAEARRDGEKKEGRRWMEKVKEIRATYLRHVENAHKHGLPSSAAMAGALRSALMVLEEPPKPNVFGGPEVPGSNQVLPGVYVAQNVRSVNTQEFVTTKDEKGRKQ